MNNNEIDLIYAKYDDQDNRRRSRICAIKNERVRRDVRGKQVSR